MKTHIVSAVLCALCAQFVFAGTQITLAEQGKTSYGIVPPAQATPMEQLAVRELQEYLKKSTGADFASSAQKTAKNIILKRDSTLREEESAVSIRGQDLILAGGDEWGVLYAVYCFLENQLGIRWFSPYGHEKVPAHSVLKLDFSPYRQRPAFDQMRAMVYSSNYHWPWSSMYFLRNRLNTCKSLKNKNYPGSKTKWKLTGYQSHTFFYYIPPAKGVYPQNLKFKEEKYYFADHPEYFAMDETGKRTMSLQLCFSNPDLRKEFTRRFLEYAELSGGEGIYMVSAQDWPGSYCYCPECAKLEKKYSCICGPLLDYLTELCGVVEKRYPKIFLKFGAYRKDQSEKPPVMSGKLPKNLIVDFSPIDDDFSKNFAHSNNAGTYENIKNWCRLTDHVMLYYYPLVYGGNAPFGGFRRTATDTRMAYEAGVRATFYEHDSGGLFEGLNFGDMMTWMLLKLWQDPKADPQALIREFCDFYYGKASPEMVSYINDLDDISARFKNFHPWNGGPIPGAFSADNLLKWTKLFDKMEQKTASDPEVRKRVKDARISLDLELLNHAYPELHKKYPDVIPPAPVLRERIQKAFDDSLMRRLPQHKKINISYFKKKFENTLATAYMKATVKPKPLPPELEKLPAKAVRQVFVVQTNRCGIIKDPDAGFGQAIYDHKSKGAEIPFYFGVYDIGAKKRHVTTRIEKKDIVPDQYHFYKVGDVPITSGSQIFTGKSWICGINLAHLYRMGESPDKKYEVWISMKFEGPGYSSKSKAEKDRVLIDRAVVVER